MSGKLIVIEGADGSGKETQSGKLYDRLKLEGYNIHKVTFPDYASDSSTLIKMYLRGEFGSNPAKVNAYAAATFYAADRWVSFCTSWGKLYREEAIILADRYVTSNMAHQSVKFTDSAEREKFLDWLWDLEFIKFSLPVPDAVVFLDMPPQYSLELIGKRQAKTLVKDLNQDKDIHEENTDYLTQVYQSYQLMSQKYGWLKVNCANQNGLRSIKAIHDDIYQAVINKI